MTYPVPTHPHVQGFVNPRFTFDGGAGSYLGTTILAILVTLVSFGLAYPFALVLLERWRCEHSFIDGRPLKFNGTGMSLFGNWLKWLLLCLVTLGIYSLWVVPRLQQWKWENTSFAPVYPG